MPRPADFHAVVAIPVKDEAERIGACLDALARQASPRVVRFSVLLFCNDCSDGSVAVASALRERLPFALHIREAVLAASDAHAGGARRRAMEEAAELLRDVAPDRAVILTTDADSRVAPDWLDANLAAIAGGADAVAGLVEADPDEHARLPASVRWRGRREDRYEKLLAEIDGRIDDHPHDPWPRHRMASGASIAVTVAAYRQVGGMPPQPLGEDRAFVALLEDRGRYVRRSVDAKVTTSCRLDGRARGGTADTIRHRAAEPDTPCDPALEPALTALSRAWRRAATRRHRGDVAAGAVPRRPLRPSELRGQIVIASLIVAVLRAFAGVTSLVVRPLAVAAGRAGSGRFAAAESRERPSQAPS